ncbi:hypothetical protein OH76DRAFT_1419427 [Lentinus brumalis]|uniref:Uncharacterized protein n=1 Tax=Lentinus brumalis TaxID=2498619 RepID=A0A371D5I8_9APHY|nr:hypothetical protein OH76DRAFT_1419427 [Polyporus brumalis]
MFAREGHLEMDRHMERRSGTYMHILTNTDWDELRTSVQDGWMWATTSWLAVKVLCVGKERAHLQGALTARATWTCTGCTGATDIERTENWVVSSSAMAGTGFRVGSWGLQRACYSERNVDLCGLLELEQCRTHRELTTTWIAPARSSDLGGGALLELELCRKHRELTTTWIAPARSSDLGGGASTCETLQFEVNDLENEFRQAKKKRREKIPHESASVCGRNRTQDRRHTTASILGHGEPTQAGAAAIDDSPLRSLAGFCRSTARVGGEHKRRASQNVVHTAPPASSNMPLDPNTYHPDLEPAVQAAYAANIDLTIIPALLRLKQFKGGMEEAVKWFRDFTTVREDDCIPCVEAGRECTRHNGSSIRCLACYVTDARACTHQTKMVQLGHAATPSCMDYKHARDLGLTPIPASLKWTGKRGQEKLKNAIVRGRGQKKARNEKDVTGETGETGKMGEEGEEGETGETGEEGEEGETGETGEEGETGATGDTDTTGKKDETDATGEIAEPTGVVGEPQEGAKDGKQPRAGTVGTESKGKQRADRVPPLAQWTVQTTHVGPNESDQEDIDQLQDDDPPVAGKGKAGNSRKPSTRRKTKSGDTSSLAHKGSIGKKTTDENTAILGDICTLLEHLVKTNDELLHLKRRRYELSSDSSSESDSKAKRPRTDDAAAAAPAGPSNVATARPANVSSQTVVQANPVSRRSRPAGQENAAAGPSSRQS